MGNKGLVRIAAAWWLPLAAAGFFLAAPAEAQQTTPPAPQPAAKQKGVEEIVVTARKREESVQDIPIAVSAFGEDDLERANISDISDVQFNVPNVGFSRTNFGGSSFSIRGIGALSVAASGDAGTGVHINNVPVNAPRLFDSDFYDLERVEVLRGPQGTLFGRNAPAGGVSFMTRRPTNELSSDIEVQAGNYRYLRWKANVNVPISEYLRVRVSGLQLSRNGFTENVNTGTDIDDRKLWALRSTIAADFSENTHGNLMLSWFDEDDQRSRVNKQACHKDRNPFPFSIGCLPDKLEYEAINGSATLGGMLGNAIGLYGPGNPDVYADTVNPDDLRKVNARIDPRYKSNEFLSTFELAHTMGALTLSSTTGYQWQGTRTNTDYLWSVASVPFAGGTQHFEFPGSPFEGDYGRDIAFDTSNGESRQWTEEVRLTSDYDGMFNFTLGGIILDFRSEGDYAVYAAALEAFGPILGSTPNLDFYRNETRPYDLESRAGFGEMYVDVTPSTHLTGGVRLTHDMKKVRARVNLYPPKTQYGEDTAAWTEFTYKAGISQDVPLPFADSAMAYFTYSRGYKGGGFNPPVNAPGVPATFEPEFINSYELGWKSTLFDSMALVNLTGFYYDYEDYQISKIVERTSVNENVNADIYGAELESILQPLEGLRFNANIAYLATKVKDFSSIDPADPTAGVPGAVPIKDIVAFDGSNVVITPGGNIGDPTTWIDGYETDAEGNSLPNTPRWTVSLGGEYSLRLLDKYDMTTRVDWYWQDDMYGRIFNLSRDEIDSWSRMDAQVSFQTETSPWRAEIWIKNIANHDDVTGMYLTDASSANFTNLFILEPRTYGFTLSYSWQKGQ